MASPAQYQQYIISIFLQVSVAIQIPLSSGQWSHNQWHEERNCIFLQENWFAIECQCCNPVFSNLGHLKIICVFAPSQLLKLGESKIMDCQGVPEILVGKHCLDLWPINYLTLVSSFVLQYYKYHNSAGKISFPSVCWEPNCIVRDPCTIFHTRDLHKTIWHQKKENQNGPINSSTNLEFWTQSGR